MKTRKALPLGVAVALLGFAPAASASRPKPMKPKLVFRGFQRAYLRVEKPERLRMSPDAFRRGREAVERVVRGYQREGAKYRVSRADQQALAQIEPAARAKMLSRAAKRLPGFLSFSVVDVSKVRLKSVKSSHLDQLRAELAGQSPVSLNFRDDHSVLFDLVMRWNVSSRARPKAGDVSVSTYE